MTELDKAYNLLMHGRILLRDNKDEQALRLFEQAAELGCSDSQFLIAFCLIHGRGTKKDLTAGYAAMVKAADMVICNNGVLERLKACKKRKTKKQQERINSVLEHFAHKQLPSLPVVKLPRKSHVTTYFLTRQIDALKEYAEEHGHIQYIHAIKLDAFNKMASGIVNGYIDGKGVFKKFTAHLKLYCFNVRDNTKKSTNHKRLAAFLHEEIAIDLFVNKGCIVNQQIYNESNDLKELKSCMSDAKRRTYALGDRAAEYKALTGKEDAYSYIRYIVSKLYHDIQSLKNATKL